MADGYEGTTTACRGKLQLQTTIPEALSKTRSRSAAENRCRTHMDWQCRPSSRLGYEGAHSTSHRATFAANARSVERDRPAIIRKDYGDASAKKKRRRRAQASTTSLVGLYAAAAATPKNEDERRIHQAARVALISVARPQPTT